MFRSQARRRKEVHQYIRACVTGIAISGGAKACSAVLATLVLEGKHSGYLRVPAVFAGAKVLWGPGCAQKGGRRHEYHRPDRWEENT